MEQAKIEENTNKLLAFVDRKFKGGELNNDSLVELFKYAGDHLNLQTIPDYARKHNMSYEGVKKFRKIEDLFCVKFVIDNE